MYKDERKQLAREAYDLGCDVVRAVVAVMGADERQTYLHDIVYGLAKLIIILGKPYLGATEGNEHAHQEIKKDFHTMCCHSNKKFGSMMQTLRLHHLRRKVFHKFSGFAPPTKESEANLGKKMDVRESKRRHKNHDDAIPIADSHLEAAKQTQAAMPAGKRPAQNR